ncbi:hypothetical protein [Thalassospira xiamenensis]|uniref:hypothetical protein n=1 Tax=Thalassospira xiamenensis TaxID=220697 RepID=UPI0011BE6634|nr:hypothetical protein [Thalassospira xiamenensis]
MSADAIVPVLLDGRRQGFTDEIRFYVQSPKTMKALKENSILWSALNQLGDVLLAVPESRQLGAILRHRLFALWWLPRLALSVIFGQAKIIHFGQLYSSAVYRILVSLRKSSVMVVEGAFAGFSETQTTFAKLKVDRSSTFDLSRVKNIAVFEGDSELAKKVRHRGRTPIVIGKPHNLSGWIDFLDERCADVFPEDHKEIFSIILGTFGKLDFFPAENTAEKLLTQTIDILLERGQGRPIYIKPHVITDRDELERILSKYADAPILITDLHPSILAKRAVFTLANYYSTVLSTVHGNNGITVEYTHYSEKALQLSNGRSMRDDSVTHFIQNDPEALRVLVSQLCSKADKNCADIERGSTPDELMRWIVG